MFLLVFFVKYYVRCTLHFCIETFIICLCIVAAVAKPAQKFRGTKYGGDT